MVSSSSGADGWQLGLMTALLALCGGGGGGSGIAQSVSSGSLCHSL